MTQNGTHKGLYNIMNSLFSSLKFNEYPIVCTDAKRNINYVKQQHVWEKETDSKSMNRLCNVVKHEVSKSAMDIINSDKDYTNPTSDKYDTFLTPFLIYTFAHSKCRLCRQL